MKSPQQDNKNKTSCKECVLAVYDGNTQTACSANRLEKLDHFEAYDNEKEFFVVESFCNFYRNNPDEYTNKDGSIDLDRIKEECKISFDIIVLCNNIDEEYAKHILDLHSNLEKVYKNKFSFQLLYTIATKEQVAIIKRLSVTLNCSVTFYSDDVYLHTFLSKTSKSYHAIMSRESRFDESFLLSLNSLVNENMKKIITYKKHNVYAISNLAYKITSFQNESTVYGDIINDIINKTKETDLYYEQE